jgi:hypothetical protein
VAGFSSPLFLLGLGSLPSVTQGGFRTPLPFWNAGAGEALPDVTKGGQEEVIRQQYIRREKQLKLKKYEEGILPDNISEVTKEVLAKGKAEVNGIEVKVESIPTPPVPTISAAAPSLVDIESDVDREIAELIRIQENILYAKLVIDYQAQVRKFEEEFLVFLILIMD